MFATFCSSLLLSIRRHAEEEAETDAQKKTGIFKFLNIPQGAK
jgi:hypothetical protein